MSMYVQQSDPRAGRIVRHPKTGRRVKVIRVDICIVGMGAYTVVEYRRVFKRGRLGIKREWVE